MIFQSMIEIEDTYLPPLLSRFRAACSVIFANDSTSEFFSWDENRFKFLVALQRCSHSSHCFLFSPSYYCSPFLKLNSSLSASQHLGSFIPLRTSMVDFAQRLFFLSFPNPLLTQHNLAAIQKD